MTTPTETALPDGLRRITEAEERWLAEAHRWTTVSTHSAWVAGNNLKAIVLPGRELWMTAEEWDALRESIKRGEWDGL